jgi:hypothetical protein
MVFGRSAQGVPTRIAFSTLSDWRGVRAPLGARRKKGAGSTFNLKRGARRRI